MTSDPFVIFNDLERALFYGSPADFRSYADLANHCRSRVVTSDARGSVLETWLFLDFSVRRLLMTGLGLSALDCDFLNLQDRVLPQRAVDGTKLIQKIERVNRDLPVRPEAAWGGGLFRKWKFFEEFDPGLLDRIEKAEDAYRLEFCLPSIDRRDNSATHSDQTRYRWLSDGWLSVAARLDDAWLKSAERLNKARNLAAHSIDQAKIAAQLGFNGPDAASRVPNECLSILNIFLGVGTESR